MSLFKKNPATRAKSHADLHGADPRDGPPEAGMTFDPVCDMWVRPDEAPASTTYEGRDVHFCAPGCKVAFEKNPEKFAARLP